MLKTILFKPSVLAFGLFLLIHVSLFSFNVAEWGDSYRILRAAEFIKQGTYPSDEKRPPLFAFILSLRPVEKLDPVLWGRGVVLILSLASFLVFSQLIKEFVPDAKTQLFAKLLFMFNPVYLYWSIRVMSDVLFSLLVLLAFYLFYCHKKSFRPWALILLGITCGLAIMTRFEGYILTASISLGVLLVHKTKLLNTLLFGAALLVIWLPYVVFFNPFGSSYLQEPAGRSYGALMIWTYLASFLYFLGIYSQGAILLSKAKDIKDLLIKHIPLSVFLVMELIIILLWPAAIPRLFVPIIPFFIILFVKFWDNEPRFFILHIFFFGFLLVSQYFLKLQFLVSDKIGFLLILAIQAVIFAVSLVKFKRFDPRYLLVFSCLVWSFLIIKDHQNIFISVKNAGEYINENLSGNFVYNDVSSVSDWYINLLNPTPNRKGRYYNMDKSRYLEKSALLDENIDYLVITNEHNTSMELDLSKRPYLELIKEFRYNVKGAEFYTKIAKFNRD
ncbi:hypothetical protein A3K34_03125 [candidate division WWE3 bacterium RIFOXYC1_FULL_40_10]|nr:MAG: hypothetical protein A3K58_03125 [candidate division WWE3 bacterium RIFOXYB1_FULL_40_22]OGC61840.1 MAG: hypothetical protein A3K37_03125 [candidate division WWE3 bacterium RIFOXYA1_FULL_40_11]OGC66223.1 MAG: hypothetical protein A3K34_03125 [candidate division WWE3 bacterium RIFOXYC1_FULL_40_10]OGC70494.1 MAG: hypothetical protein A2602_02310 [candidate division WWE3 bacterium RIFOXYD1_FULL_40_11]